jgi:hypothetical protein
MTMHRVAATLLVVLAGVFLAPELPVIGSASTVEAQQRPRRRRRPRREPPPAERPAEEEAPAPGEAAPPSLDDAYGTEGSEEGSEDNLEFDARVVRGETAGEGAVVLVDRGRRALRPLVRRRTRFLRPTLRAVLGPRVRRRTADP